MGIKIGRSGSANISSVANNRQEKVKGYGKNGHRKLQKYGPVFKQLPKNDQAMFKLTRFTPLNSRTFYPITVQRTYVNPLNQPPLFNTSPVVQTQMINLQGALDLQLPSGVTLSFNQSGQLQGGFYQPQPGFTPQPLYVFSANTIPAWTSHFHLAGYEEPVKGHNHQSARKGRKRKKTNSQGNLFSHLISKKKKSKKADNVLASKQKPALKKNTRLVQTPVPHKLQAKADKHTEKLRGTEHVQSKKAPPRPPPPTTLIAAKKVKQQQITPSAYHQQVTKMPSLANAGKVQNTDTSNTESVLQKRQPPPRPPLPEILQGRTTLKKQDGTKDVPPPQPAPPAAPPPPPISSFSQDGLGSPRSPLSTARKKPSEAVSSENRSDSTTSKVSGDLVKPSAEQLQEEIKRRAKRGEQKTSARKEVKAERNQSGDQISEMANKMEERRRKMGYNQDNSKFTRSDELKNNRSGKSSRPDHSALNRAEPFDNTKLKEVNKEAKAYPQEGRAQLNKAIEDFDLSMLKKTDSGKKTPKKESYSGNLNPHSPKVDDMIYRAQQQHNDDESKSDGFDD